MSNPIPANCDNTSSSISTKNNFKNLTALCGFSIPSSSSDCFDAVSSGNSSSPGCMPVPLRLERSRASGTSTSTSNKKERESV